MAQMLTARDSDVAKGVVLRLFDEVYNEGRLALLPELVAEHAVDHERLPDAEAGDVREDLRHWIETLRTAIPDLQVEVQQVVAEGGTVATRAVMRGTHEFELLEIPATGRPLQWETFDICRVENGLIVEHWGVADLLRMLGELGALRRQ